MELLDVRTPAKFRALHLTISKNVPLDQLDAAAYLKSRSRGEEPIYVVCQAGTRSRLGVEAFLKAGFTNALIVNGGVNLCATARQV